MKITLAVVLFIVVGGCRDKERRREAPAKIVVSEKEAFYIDLLQR
jgi:hypothetical protein